MLVVSVMVALRPAHRTVTIGSYHFAAAQWWRGQSLYIGPAGMNYLPHFAILFSLFHALPLWLGEVLWRVIAATALAFGLWRVVRALFLAAAERPYFWATLAAMPLCMSALRNGNANAQFGGGLLLATAAILERRWGLSRPCLRSSITGPCAGGCWRRSSAWHYSRSFLPDRNMYGRNIELPGSICRHVRLSVSIGSPISTGCCKPLESRWRRPLQSSYGFWLGQSPLYYGGSGRDARKSH